jgi:hypothetical protein
MSQCSSENKGVAFKSLEMLLSEQPDFNIPKWNRLFDLYYSSSNREAVEYLIKSFKNCQASEAVADGINQLKKYLERK